MKRTISTLSAIIMIALFSNFVHAQTVHVLNSVEPISAKGNDLSEVITDISIDISLFEENQISQGDELQVYLDPETFQGYTITRVQSYTKGTQSYIGKDTEGNLIAFTYNDGSLNGVLFNNNSEDLEIQSSSSKHSLKRHVLGEDFLSCGIDHSMDSILDEEEIQRIRSLSKGKSSSIDTFAPYNFATDDTVTIDILVAYTDSAESWSSRSAWRDIDGVIAQSLNLSQLAFDNSNAAIELRLVHTHNSAFDEGSSTVSNVILTQLTSRPDFFSDAYESSGGVFDDIHQLRDEYGADIVSMFGQLNDVGGIAWLLFETNGFPELGFNLNRVQQIANTFTLVHEIGHNMGSSHSRTQDVGAAALRGALFHYSVGYQDFVNGAVTVMGYSQPGLFEVPLFSAPDLIWQGAPVGTNSKTAPENSARSVREIKRAIASYRPSLHESPVIAAGADLITIEVNNGDAVSIPLSIANQGASNLQWEIDFDFDQSPLSKSQTSTRSIEPAIQNLSGFGTRRKADFTFNDQFRYKGNAENVVYSTSFELGEGFSFGNFEAYDLWRGMTGGDEVVVAFSNASDQFQHLRLGANNDSTYHAIGGPYLGRLPIGNYEVSFDFALSGSEVSNEAFDMVFYDSKTGEASSGIIIADNFTLYAYSLGEGGVASFWSTSAVINPDQYHSLSIQYDSDNAKIHYFIDGNLVRTTDYIEGFTPDEIIFVNRHQVVNSILDIDNFKVIQKTAPFSWLSIDEYSGHTAVGNQSVVNLNFDSDLVEPGVYSSTLVIRNNDPNNSAYTIPIELSVSGTVSNEEDENPTSFSLSQNFPNPFNPSTNITYSLPSAERVSLEVFNIQGQRVATLVEGLQAAGEHQINFDADGLSSGLYFYTLRAGSNTQTRKMLLIK